MISLTNETFTIEEVIIGINVIHWTKVKFSIEIEVNEYGFLVALPSIVNILFLPAFDLTLMIV